VVPVLLYGAADVMALGVADPEVERELDKVPEKAFRQAEWALETALEAEESRPPDMVRVLRRAEVLAGASAAREFDQCRRWVREPASKGNPQAPE
jgi:hypothetical protein